MNMTTRCHICSEDVDEGHERTKRHLKNTGLYQLAEKKKEFTQNRNGIVVSCTVCPTAINSEPVIVNSEKCKINVPVKPREGVKFNFNIKNNNHHEIIFAGIGMLSSKKLNFRLLDDELRFGTATHCIEPRTCFNKEVSITFEDAVIGVKKLSTYFFFDDNETEKSTIIFKELTVFVEAIKKTHEIVISPYTREGVFADRIVPTTASRESDREHGIPSKDYEIVFAHDLGSKGLTDEQKKLAEEIKSIFEEGPEHNNYVKFWKHLLWFEETVVALNLQNYNMSGVVLLPRGVKGKSFALRVPGLAEKRPSLMLGDLVHVRPHGQTAVLFEAVITEIEDNYAQFGGFDLEFHALYSKEAKFDIRFFMSRVPLQRMHTAVGNVQSAQAATRIYPKGIARPPPIKGIQEYFNPNVEVNPEQRSAVEHIVAGSSGTAPYLLFGPPGTGKTVTIVEAILQLIRKPGNRIMICTDSNMAADHVASKIIEHLPQFHKDDKVSLLRANSEFRVWETLPKSVAPYSNGTKRSNSYRISIAKFLQYDIVITTLIHAAKFARELKKKNYERAITHLFIDEAAQASEPAALVPICGLLAPHGQLVLAGDPMQLGPIVTAHRAAKEGLGVSLMERLKKEFPLYQDNNYNYITMLKKNYRSHQDILDIPSELFYGGQLKSQVRSDSISRKAILDVNKKSRAIEFHGILSREQRMGKSPSFYNDMEMEMVQTYITALLTVHGVAADDIGVISPYIRQVYKIKKALRASGVEGVEVGTVEAFQGREKRVIIVSCVRATCDLFAHDAKFQLGFLVNPKRFNVALTRAKSKLIVIGNPLCLRKDPNWKIYMQRCRDIGTYSGFEGSDDTELDHSEVLEQISPILEEITKALSKMTM